ncbi:MAG: nucleoside deaminase [Prevotellaceae bacterium]|jgi:tRNA(Arg) A34 adenosine deaminase TadA|nr:nucleoside deaminase [Prevotellaceae bacterium]
MTKQQKDFMREAIHIAEENMNKRGGGPFGAVMVKDGKIVAKAANTDTTSNDPTAHAEVNTIRLACQSLNTFNLAGCELYASCEPCPMCLASVYWARIDKIYYAASGDDAQEAGFDDSFIYSELASPIALREVKMVNMLSKEGRLTILRWKGLEDKVNY